MSCHTLIGMKTRISRAFRAFFLFPVVAAVAAAVLALPQARAQSADVAVLQSEMTDVKAAIIRIDERLVRMDDKFTNKFERMDERLDRLEQIVVRLDERMNGFQMQNQFVIIPLLLLLLATMFGLLTKGILWGVERAPKVSSGASRRGHSATQPTAVAP